MAKRSKNVVYYESVGRRKSAVARVRLYISSAKNKLPKDIAGEAKKGDIFVNNMPIASYFSRATEKRAYTIPFELTDSTDRFIITTMVSGGGIQGQLEALQLGIARALEMVNDEYRMKLKPQGLLSRDSRIRERRKVGTGGRARRQKQSPKR